MNIFLRELKYNLKSLLIWAGIVIIFSLIGFSKFSAFYGNEDILVVLESVPPVMLDALNMRAFNLTTVTGFYGAMITYYTLILSISAIMWGSNSISKEERERTVEFSLTLPVTRAQLITAKTAAMLVNCVVLLLITWGITIVNAQPYNPTPEFYNFVAISMLAFLFLQLIFLALGVFLACALKHHKQSGSMAVSLVLGTYFLSIIAGLSADLEFLKYFSPFKYFDPGLLLRESTLEFPFVLLSIGIFVVSLAGAYLSYAKRDLYI